MARLVALTLAITLTGPSIAALACGWTCALHSEVVADAGTSGCHEPVSRPDQPTLAAGHVCHDLATGAVLVQPPPMYAPLAVPAVTVASADHGDVTRGRAVLRSPAFAAPPGVPVSILPLRI